MKSEKYGDSFGATFKAQKVKDQKIFKVEDSPSFTTKKSSFMEISQERQGLENKTK